MSELITKLHDGQLVGAIAIISGCTVALVISVTAIIARRWGAVRQAELEAALKQQLLERGMSADEIAKVVTATSGDR